MKLRFLLAATAITALNAQAVTYGNYQLEALVGSGSSTSACVFDFGTAQYAFGYAYDGAKTGSDLLKALQDANLPGLSITLVVDPVYGDYVKEIAYAPTVMPTPYSLVTSASFADDPYLYPNYWTGSGDPTRITAWSSPWDYGISGRALTNGSWDGFTQAKYYTSGAFVAEAPAGAFAVAVPEPAALSLLALGGLTLLRRRR